MAPEDVSIVGYDNYLYGNPFAEKLTTYNVDMKQMARQAVKLLKGKMKGDDKYWEPVYRQRGYRTAKCERFKYMKEKTQPGGEKFSSGCVFMIYESSHFPIP